MVSRAGTLFHYPAIDHEADHLPPVAFGDETAGCSARHRPCIRSGTITTNKQIAMDSTPSIRRLFRFDAGDSGPWLIEQATCLAGDSMPAAPRLSVHTEAAALDNAVWSLQGITSNERYVERLEKTALVSRQEGLGRPTSTCAALIPIRKTAAWWALPQDERREIF